MPEQDDAGDRAYVLSQHAALRQLLVERDAQIAELVNAADEVVAGLKLVCDRLDEYFDGQSSEELDERLQARFPQLRHAVGKFREERGQLAQFARSAAQDSTDAASAARRTAKDFHALRGLFASHEHRGNTLLQEAYNIDLGAED